METHAPLGQVQEAEGSGPQLSLEAQGCQPTCCMLSGFFGMDIASIQREVLQCQAGCKPEPPGASAGSPSASVARHLHLQSECVRASGLDSRSHLVQPVAWM